MDKNLENLLLSRISTAMESYSKIVTCERTDKIFAGIPKYTTRTEISKDILNLDTYEDRGLLTFVLEAGEFVEYSSNTKRYVEDGTSTKPPSNR